MLKKIKVYGTLKKFLGQSEFEVDLNTPREAISFLKCNFERVEEKFNKIFLSLYFDDAKYLPHSFQSQLT